MSGSGSITHCFLFSVAHSYFLFTYHNNVTCPIKIVWKSKLHITAPEHNFFTCKRSRKPAGYCMCLQKTISITVCFNANLYYLDGAEVGLFHEFLYKECVRVCGEFSFCVDKVKVWRSSILYYCNN